MVGAPEGQAHVPVWHVMPPVQACPQVAQLFASLVVSTSQPVAGSLSQSAKPEAHDEIAQFDALQVAVAWARVQALPQLPQWLTSLVVLISQPVEATVSQSA
jgi:hypothetical protein